MTTKYCMECGRELPTHAKFCASCGAEQLPSDQTERPGIGSGVQEVTATSNAVRTPEETHQQTDELSPGTPTHAPPPRPAPGSSQERSGRRWMTVVWYVIAVAIWILFAVPYGAALGPPTGFFASLVGTFALAALVRGIYAHFKDRRFWSPWLFILAALFAFGGMASDRQQEQAEGKRGLARATCAEECTETN